MSEETKAVKTEEEVTETKQVEETKPAVTTTEAEPEEPKEEPKKGFFKKVTESKPVKVVGTVLAIVGLLKLGETIGEAKERKRSESEIIDVEPTSDNDDETVE
jgi:hypothetical protein